MANTTTATTWQQVANELANAFETRYRTEGDDSTRYVTLSDEARGTWMQDAVFKAHGDELPDDWIYDVCESAAMHCSEYESADEATDDAGHEFADGQVDTYNADRIKWLQGSLYRAYIADEAAEDMGADNSTGIYARIGLGQYEMATQILGTIARAISDEAERRDDEAEADAE